MYIGQCGIPSNIEQILEKSKELNQKKGLDKFL